MKRRIHPRWRRAIFGIAFAGLALLLACCNEQPQTKPAKVPQAPAATPEPEPTVGAMGWEDRPADVAAIVASLPQPKFSQTPAGRIVGDTIPDHVYLWESAKKARSGQQIPTRNQGSVGSCVSFGSACACEYLIAFQIASGKRGDFKDLAQEVIYGGSRVQIGGGRISGDGSTGAWAAQWCQKYGVVPRGTYGSYNLAAYSENTCRQFGRSGCPKELEPIAQQSPVKAITQVNTSDDVRKALSQGYPVTVASDQGFQGKRDANGFIAPNGKWPHQMAIIGFRSDTPGFYIMNSWGESWTSGPYGPGDPPPGGFWASDTAVNRMVSQKDSFAYSDAVGFPSRKVDWSDFAFRAEPSLRRDDFPDLKLLFAFAMAP